MPARAIINSKLLSDQELQDIQQHHMSTEANAPIKPETVSLCEHDPP